MKVHRCAALIVTMTTIGGFLGCTGGEDSVPTATITGEVKRMTGEPFDDVMVVFYPQTGPTSVARTDDAGRFTAQVALGEAQVAVIASPEASSSDNSPDAVAPTADQKPRIKPMYATPETSGLTVKVEAEQAEKVVLVVE